jgi:predicted nucleotidyltransferase
MLKQQDKGIRLHEDYLAAIKKIFLLNFLPQDELWLFGSRTNLYKKGGDIDLYIETNLENYDTAIDRKINFLTSLVSEIG